MAIVNYIPLEGQRVTNYLLSNVLACSRTAIILNQLPTNPITAKNFILRFANRPQFQNNELTEDTNNINIRNNNIDEVGNYNINRSRVDSAFESMFEIPSIEEPRFEDHVFLTDGDYQINLPIYESRITLRKDNPIQSTIINDPKEPLTPEQNLDPNVPENRGLSGSIKRITNTGDWIINIQFLVINKDSQFVSPEQVAGINYFSNLTRPFQIQCARLSIHEIEWVVLQTVQWEPPSSNLTRGNNVLICSMTLLSDSTRELPNLDVRPVPTSTSETPATEDAIPEELEDIDAGPFLDDNPNNPDRSNIG